MSDREQVSFGLVGYGEIGSTLDKGLRAAGPAEQPERA